MGRGHRKDASTLALYRMDEPDFGGNTSAVGAVKGYTFANTLPNANYITNGPNGTRYARFLDDSYQMTGPTVTAGDLTMWQGQWTIECFIKPALTAGGYIFSVRGTGASGVGNDQGSVYIYANGHVEVHWHSGTGSTNRTFTTTGTAPLTANVWQHLAVEKTATDVKIYVNGSLTHTMAWTVNADIGTSSKWNFNHATALNGSRGRIKDLSVSNIARGATAIAAHAALVSSTAQHPIDANTYELWRFNEAPGMIDESDAGMHLTPTQASSAFVTNAHAPFIRDGGFCKGFIGTTNGYNVWPVSVDADGLDSNIAALIAAEKGNFTLEVWIRLFELNWASRRAIFGTGNGGGGAANNCFTVEIDDSRKIRATTQSGANVSAAEASTWVIPLTDTGNWHHLAARKTGAGATFVWDFFWDAVKVHTSGAITQFSSGTDGDLNIGNGVISGQNDWQGLLDDMRLSTIARTDQEIADSYKRGLGYPDRYLRARDSGTGGYVTWGPTAAPETWLTPVAADTSPNFTGTLSDVHEWLAVPGIA